MEGSTKLAGLVAAAMVAACAGAPPSTPPPPPGPSGLAARHFDQVCRPQGRAPTEVRLEEIFDTAGLVRELADVGIRPLPLTPPWPLYDFITHYDRWGRPVAMGTWDATVPDSVVGLLETALRRRVRAVPGGLLEGAAYRTQVAYARRVDVRLAPAVECMPHIYHRPGERLLGLPDDVATQGGTTWIPEGDATAAVVRIRVAADGSVTQVDGVRGTPEAVAWARDLVGALRFDPALRNGVPVAGELVQTFRRRATPPPAPWQSPPRRP